MTRWIDKEEQLAINKRIEANDKVWASWLNTNEGQDLTNKIEEARIICVDLFRKLAICEKEADDADWAHVDSQRARAKAFDAFNVGKEESE